MKDLFAVSWRTLVALLLASAIGFAFAVLNAGCATDVARGPTVSVLRTREFRPVWFGDDQEIVITVSNPLDVPVRVAVECEPYGELPDWVVEVPAHGEVRGLGQVLNKYLVGQPCRRGAWWPAK